MEPRHCPLLEAPSWSCRNRPHRRTSEHQVLLEHQGCCSPAPLSCCLAMLCCQRRLRPPREEARQLHLATPPLMAGAGTAGPPQFGPRPWSRAGAPLGMAWFGPEGSVLITRRPAACAFRAANGVLDPRPISGVPEGAGQGQGGLLDVGSGSDFRAQPFHLSELRGQASVRQTAPGWRARRLQRQSLS